MNRETWLHVVEMHGCGQIPCHVVISGAVWKPFEEQLRGIIEKYPDVAVELLGLEEEGERFGDRYRPCERWTDRWGCVWDNRYGGIEGQVVEHPLEDWGKLSDFEPPDPAAGNDMSSLDWEAEAERIEQTRKKGEVAQGGVSHGFIFQRLYYLRGFDNLMLDIASGEPRLEELIEMLKDFNLALVRRYLELGVDMMYFGDDLGMQTGLMISPDHWRRYIKPAYAGLFEECREAGVKVYLHSDGYIVDIMPDLVEIGVDILNPQDLCNGLENIRRELSGRVCIDLDIDRQSVIPWGTAGDIDAHVRRCVDALASPEGGLMMICGIYPPTPPENVEALLAALTKHCVTAGERTA